MTAAGPDEAWGFEWGSADGHGGFVRLALQRSRRVAWYWAYLWQPGGGPVVVRDHEVMLPRGAALEIRADALWSELVCETPDEHWSIGLEAFGVRLDEPGDALRGEIGERIALGFDFEWETGGDPFVAAIGGLSFTEQPGRVRGEILLGRERIELDAVGHFEHGVGERPADPSSRSTIAWDDGSWTTQWTGPNGQAAARWVDGHVEPVPAGGLDGAAVGVGVDAAVVSAATGRLDGAPIEVTVAAEAIIPAGELVISRSIGRASASGRSGVAWIESAAGTVRRSPDGSRPA